MKLTHENYYSEQANKEYMSVSQFKDFELCEQYALAKINGDFVEEKSKAMLVGGYVDAYFSNRLDQFKLENPQIFKKDGTLLKDFEKANEIIKTIESDEFFVNHIKGETQVILTGEIGGVKWKGALDFLNDRIIDLKCVASIVAPVWVERDNKNIKTNFIDAYGYDLQGAIYQELVKQNTSEIKPFDIAVVSKEEEPDKAIINLPNDLLKEKLEYAKSRVERYDLIKKGVIPPQGCGNCPVCRKLKKLDKVVDYNELFGKETNE